MKKNYLWTTLKARLQFIKSHANKPFNWLFLPGGPGLGSESLNGLTQLLELPGTSWYLDLPGDGSNTTVNDSQFFSHWSAALLEAVEALDKVILVAHSTGGMYALATPALERSLVGLVLIDSAPNASWQQHFINYAKEHPLPEVGSLQKIYMENPNDDVLRQLTIASAPYLFTGEGLKKDISFLASLPINYRTCEWSAQHFDTVYKAKWIPKNIPTLILGGDNDHVTPLNLFTETSDFQRKNILIREIKNAGHFPWIESPEQIISVFKEYCQILLNDP